MIEAIPKCKSWLGHRFEARYSEGDAPSLTPRQLDEMWFHDARVRNNLTARPIIYECDVCIRCGHVVSPPVIITNVDVDRA